MSDAAIQIESLKKRFGPREVLADVSLSVPRGTTFGFLGRNGQGKTTTIRILLGLLTRDGGQVRVDGLDPARDALRLRARVGYLAEDQRMFGWMTVQETLSFLRPFYPTWDDAHAAQLLRDFELSPKERVERLSKGQNARLGLLLALAHRPPTVILDDPTLGLDPIMRKQLLRHVIDLLQGNGTTVFFSSHLLYEIEPVVDAVAILEGGRIARQAGTEELRADVRQLVLSAEDYARIGSLPHALDVRSEARRAAIVVEKAEEARTMLQKASVSFEEVELNLDEIFEAYVIGNKGAVHA